MPQNPKQSYQIRLDSGALSADPVQAQAIETLQTLFDALAVYKPKKGIFSKKQSAPGGVYMYGGVGRGKSMLMDLFYECLDDDISKRRVHFHQFMIEVHDYIHTRREVDNVNEGVDKALPMLADKIAKASRVLCFDEFHVTDVADAMLLGRLFTALFERGVTVIATSNWNPDNLYEGGLQRDRFVPFIELLKERLNVVHLDSPTDYRALCLTQEGTYFTPLSTTMHTRMDEVFAHLTDNIDPYSETIEVKGRVIEIESAASGVARFTFAQLCERPHGAEDYLAIAARYKTVFLENVPKLTYDRRNEAKRLMTLIDALYDNRIKLVMSADAPPDGLYIGEDHAFEFQRTVSRLLEMQSPAYLSA